LFSLLILGLVQGPNLALPLSVCLGLGLVWTDPIGPYLDWALWDPARAILVPAVCTTHTRPYKAPVPASDPIGSLHLLY